MALTSPLDMGDQYGRATATALRKSKQNRAQQEADMLNQFAQGGGSADQMLRLKSDLNKQGLGAEGDIMSTMGLEGAGQQFAANEARNAMEYGGNLQTSLQEGQQGFEERMYDKEAEAQRKREEAEMKQRKLETWLGFGATLGGPLLQTGLAKLIGG
jgi:hypothetical protein